MLSVDAEGVDDCDEDEEDEPQADTPWSDDADQVEDEYDEAPADDFAL